MAGRKLSTHVLDHLAESQSGHAKILTKDPAQALKHLPNVYRRGSDVISRVGNVINHDLLDPVERRLTT